MDSSAILIIWLICAALGWAIGNSKGRGGAGFALGLLLGVIGLIIILVMKPVAAPANTYQPGYQPGYQPYPAAQASPPGWWPDPYRRHEMRYFDGQRWTHHVSNRGQQASDPVG